jgi:hypothetical protein
VPEPQSLRGAVRVSGASLIEPLFTGSISVMAKHK